MWSPPEPQAVLRIPDAPEQTSAVRGGDSSRSSEALVAPVISPHAHPATAPHVGPMAAVQRFVNDHSGGHLSASPGIPALPLVATVDRFLLLCRGLRPRHVGRVSRCSAQSGDGPVRRVRRPGLPRSDPTRRCSARRRSRWPSTRAPARSTPTTATTRTTRTALAPAESPAAVQRAVSAPDGVLPLARHAAGGEPGTRVSGRCQRATSSVAVSTTGPQPWVRTLADRPLLPVAQRMADGQPGAAAVSGVGGVGLRRRSGTASAAPQPITWASSPGSWPGAGSAEVTHRVSPAGPAPSAPTATVQRTWNGSATAVDAQQSPQRIGSAPGSFGMAGGLPAAAPGGYSEVTPVAHHAPAPFWGESVSPPLPPRWAGSDRPSGAGATGMPVSAVAQRISSNSTAAGAAAVGAGVAMADGPNSVVFYPPADLGGIGACAGRTRSDRAARGALGRLGPPTRACGGSGGGSRPRRVRRTGGCRRAGDATRRVGPSALRSAVGTTEERTVDRSGTRRHGGRSA